MPWKKSSLQSLGGEPSGSGFSQRSLVEAWADTLEKTPSKEEASLFQMSDELSPKEFSTEVSYTQYQKAQIARAERLNNKRKIAAMGKTEEFSEYEQEKKDESISTTWQGVNDLIAIGNRTVAATALELARGGTAWEAFKQAASEAAVALPFVGDQEVVDIGLPKPKRQEFSEAGAEVKAFSQMAPDSRTAMLTDRWVGAGVGLLLDIFLDPTTYVMPTNAVRKLAATKFGKSIGKTVGGAVEAVTEAPWIKQHIDNTARWIMNNRELRLLEKKAARGEGASVEGLESFLADPSVASQFKGGEGAYNTYRTAEALARAELHNTAQSVESIIQRYMANTDEKQQGLLAAFLDQPDLLKKHLDELVDGGHLTADQASTVMMKARDARRITKKFFDIEARRGIVDPSVFRENYVYGVAPVTRRGQNSAIQAFEEAGIERNVSQHDARAALLLRASGEQGFTKAKVYKNTEERMLDGVDTELNAGLMLAQRGFSHAQARATRTLINSVVSNPELAVRVVDELPEDIVRQFQKKGLDFWTVKSPAGEKMTYAMPKEVVDNLNGFNKKLMDDEGMASFLKTVDALNGWWKGAAVLSPGFHVRNVAGQWFHDWNAGIGKPMMDEKSWLSAKNIPSALLRTVNRLTGKKDLNTANYLRLRAAATALLDGPMTMRKAAAKMFGGADDLADMDRVATSLKIADPHTGEIMNATAIRKELKQYGIIDTGFMGSGAAEQLEREFLGQIKDRNAQKGFWKALFGKAEDSADLAEIADPLVKTAMKRDGALSAAERLAAYTGRQNPVFAANRIMGRFLENQARAAHYLDRRLRGWKPDAARNSVIKYHFDYGEMTQVEQQVFRRLSPFFNWTRKNMPLMISSIAANPGRFSQIEKVRTAIESLSPEWKEIETPDYFAETTMTRLPFAYRGKPVHMGIDLPYLDINRMNARDFLASAHPLLTGGYEYVTNESVFTGQPVERYQGELAKGRLGELGVSKRAQFFGEKAFPPARLLDQLFLQSPDEGRILPSAVSTFGAKFSAIDTRKERINKAYSGVRVSREFLQKVKDEKKRKEQREKQKREVYIKEEY